MDRFNVVTNPVRMSLMGPAKLLYRSSHGRTFPIALQSRNYGACLECGRQLPYDWTRMRVTVLPAWPAPDLLPAMGETRRRAR
jgi:hypothetical protein